MKTSTLLLPSLLTLSVVGFTHPAEAEDIAVSFAPPAPAGADTTQESIATTPDLGTPATGDSQAKPVAQPIALTFVPPTAATTAAVAPAPTPLVAVTPAPLFTGGSDSLVARTVGHAEGTRTADGDRTRAYYGHVDPGNGVWNLGSFSFQHCREPTYHCSTPEQADDHQLRRLQQQAATMQRRAADLGVTLSLQEALNGIDLANQAPLAVLATPGYIDWLRQARAQGLTGSEAVLWARTHSYWDPQRQRWDAPGLGNVAERISQDQQRRLSAIARALETYQQQAIATLPPAAPSKLAQQAPQERVADQIIFQDLPN